MCANGCAFSMAPISAWKLRVARARAPSFELMFRNLSQPCRRPCGDRRESEGSHSLHAAMETWVVVCLRAVTGAQKKRLTKSCNNSIFCNNRNDCTNTDSSSSSEGGQNASANYPIGWQRSSRHALGEAFSSAARRSLRRCSHHLFRTLASCCLERTANRRVGTGA